MLTIQNWNACLKGQDHCKESSKHRNDVQFKTKDIKDFFMNKGTLEGTEEEKNLVCNINKGYYDSFLFYQHFTTKFIYCSRVTKNKFSKLSGRKAQSLISF